MVRIRDLVPKFIFNKLWGESVDGAENLMKLTPIGLNGRKNNTNFIRRTKEKG